MAKVDGVAVYDVITSQSVADNTSSSEFGAQLNANTVIVIVNSAEDCWCMFHNSTGQTITAAAGAGKFFVKGGIPFPVRRSGNFLYTISAGTAGAVHVNELG